MGKAIEWHPGDGCPNCGGPMPQVEAPPADVRARASDPANSTPVPQRWDTATEAQIAEHGALYRCERCDSKVRVKAAAAAAAPAAAPAPVSTTGE